MAARAAIAPATAAMLTNNKRRVISIPGPHAPEAKYGKRGLVSDSAPPSKLPYFQSEIAIAELIISDNGRIADV